MRKEELLSLVTVAAVVVVRGVAGTVVIGHSGGSVVGGVGAK